MVWFFRLVVTEWVRLSRVQLVISTISSIAYFSSECSNDVLSQSLKGILDGFITF